jgi:hypothetical protein
MRDWLRSLGLGQYEAVFRDREFEPEVLPELADAELEKLGEEFDTSDLKKARSLLDELA